MRIRNKKNAKDRLDNSPFVYVNPKENKSKWKFIFENNNPIHLEIGSGKGQFIYNMAKENPNINFIGLETQATVLSYLLNKMEKEEIKNLKLVLGNAKDITEYFFNSEVNTLYLNFSDPWPKTRHIKRRLTFENFLNKYKLILNDDKRIIQKTDNRELFEFSLQSLTNNGFVIDKISLDLTNSIYEKNNIHTEYEDKFIKERKNIYFAEYKNKI